MKKAICLYLIFTMMLTIIGVYSVYADSNANNDSLIFNMDISNYNAASTAPNKGITNSVSGNSTVSIDVPGAPALGTIPGMGTKYLTINEKNAPGSNNGVKVLDTAVNSATSLSIEMWARNKLETIGAKSPMFFLLTKGAGFHSMQCVTVNAGTLNYRPFDNTANKYFSNTQKDNWAHYVFTRTFTSAGCTWSVYINGVLATSGTDAGKTMMNQTDYYMHIGGGTYATHTPFEGDIATFKVYNKVLSMEDVVESYQNTFVPFAKQELNFESISPNEGNISAIMKKIELNFDNYVDKNSLSAVSFTKADGSPIRGKVDVALDGAVSKKVIIKYGHLDVNEHYIVTIDEDICSVNGYTLGQKRVFSFQAISSALLDIDFQDEAYVVGKAPPQGKGLTYQSSGVLNNTDNFIVRSSANGDKFITFDVSKKDIVASSLVYSDFSPALTGDVAFEIGIRAYVKDSTSYGSAVRNFFRVYSPNTLFTNIGLITSSNQITNYGTELGTTYNTVPSEDLFNYVKVIMRKGDDGFYYFDVYYKPDAYVQIKDPKLKASEVSRIMLAHIYPQREEEYNSQGVAITSVKAYPLSVPGVISSNAEELTADSKEIEVYFDSDMNVDSLDKAVYTLKNSNNEQKISVSYKEYDTESRTLYVKLNDYLDYGESYDLSIKGAKDSNGASLSSGKLLTVSVPVYEVVQEGLYFVNQDGIRVNELLGAQSITGNITLRNSSNDTKNCAVFFQHYDKNGRLVKISYYPVTVDANAVMNEKLSIGNSVFGEGDYVRCYVWDVTSSSLKAVALNYAKIPYTRQK